MEIVIDMLELLVEDVVRIKSLKHFILFFFIRFQKLDKSKNRGNIYIETIDIFTMG